MKYMGSKNRIAKEILPIMLKDRSPEQWYVEPFAGGMNMICDAKGKRIANDIHPYLIALFESVVYNYWNPIKISKQLYDDIRENKSLYPNQLVGWAGFGCSYNGKYFGGYAGEINTKIGTVRDYQQESINNLLIQKNKLIGVHFTCMPYNEMVIPDCSIIYCDPPYEGTTKYRDDINHAEFWDWCRRKSKEGHIVYVSEYNAPDDFICVWKKDIVSSLTKDTGSKIATERLFTILPLQQ